MADAERTSKRLPKGFTASSPDELVQTSHTKQRASVATFGQLLDLFAEEQAKLDAAAEDVQPVSEEVSAAAALQNSSINGIVLEQQPPEAATLRRRRSSVGFALGSSVADAETALQDPDRSSNGTTTTAAGRRSRRSSHSGPVVHRDARPTSPGRVTFNGWADLYEPTAVAGEEEDRRLLSLSPVRTPTAAEAAAADADVTRHSSQPLSPAVRMAEAVTPRVSPKQVAVLEMDGTVRPRKIVRRATGLADHLQQDTATAASSSGSSGGGSAELTGEDIGSVSEHYNTVFRDWLLTVSTLTLYSYSCHHLLLVSRLISAMQAAPP
jgi:hypothetical protein